MTNWNEEREQYLELLREGRSRTVGFISRNIAILGVVFVLGLFGFTSLFGIVPYTCGGLPLLQGYRCVYIDGTGAGPDMGIAALKVCAQLLFIALLIYFYIPFIRSRNARKISILRSRYRIKRQHNLQPPLVDYKKALLFDKQVLRGTVISSAIQALIALLLVGSILWREMVIATVTPNQNMGFALIDPPTNILLIILFVLMLGRIYSWVILLETAWER